MNDHPPTQNRFAMPAAHHGHTIDVISASCTSIILMILVCAIATPSLAETVVNYTDIETTRSASPQTIPDTPNIPAPSTNSTTHNSSTNNSTTKWTIYELADPFNTQRTRSDELVAPQFALTSDIAVTTFDVTPRAAPLPAAIWAGLLLLSMTIISIQIRKHRMFRP